MEALKYNVDKGFRRLVLDESFITSCKGYALHKVEWMPEEKPRAIMVVVHDIGDHVLRFQNLANYFISEGIGVIGIDLRGHGKSAGARGRACYDELLRDLSDLIKYTEKSYPYIPKIIYGNGLGGNLAMLYAIKQKVPIYGLIAASPWIRSYYNLASLLKAGSNIMMKIFPSLTISNGLNPKYLTHDLVNNKRYDEDSLVHRRISPRLLKEVNDAGEIILKNRHRCNVPLLLMHGSSDKVTSWRASAEFSEYTSEKTTFKLWEGDYHELHNEFDKEKIFEYILQWIKSISSTQRVIYGNF